jgi:hydrogenase-4 component B
MNFEPATLLIASLCGYVIGAVAGLLFLRREKLANVCSFGAGSLAALCGLVAALLHLARGTGAATPQFELLPALIPYIQFSVRLDALGAFFLLIVSLLGFALSAYSLGYAKGFFGRKNVAVLGAFFNALLLATTLVFVADNIWLFLIAWEIMALTAYCLVSFEHEKPETRQAGVLYFIMSHIDAGCVILGFLLLFQASGDYGFASLHDVGASMSPGKRNAAFVLFLLGFGIKAGIVPLHIWLPAAHHGHRRKVGERNERLVLELQPQGLCRLEPRGRCSRSGLPGADCANRGRARLLPSRNISWITAPRDRRLTDAPGSSRRRR